MIPIMTRPIIFTKAGIIEAKPPGFYDDLGEEYNAKLISVDQIRLDLNNGVISHDVELVGRADKEAKRQARRALKEGQNVIYDRFLNSFRRREQFRRDVVAPVGAMSILLCFQAPMQVIRDRIIARQRGDALIVPSGQISEVVRSLRLANEMADNTELPSPIEEALYLDGTHPTPQVLQLISSYIAYLDSRQPDTTGSQTTP